MAQTELKYSDFLSWTRPRDALAALDAVYRKPASTRHLLLERLKSGKILAIAESSTWRGIRGDKTGVLAVKRDQWDHFAAGEEFWQSGDLHLYLGYYQGNASSVEVWYHAIRFDPDGIQNLVDLAEEPRPAPAKPQQPEPDQKGPRVPDTLLKAWYEVYQQAYQGAADTEDTAVVSARGMFPGKSVARERVRELRGEQKRGRKPSGPAN